MAQDLIDVPTRRPRSVQGSILKAALLLCEEQAWVVGATDAELFICSDWFWVDRGQEGGGDTWSGRLQAWPIWGTWDSRYKGRVIAMLENGRIVANVPLPSKQLSKEWVGLNDAQVECAMRVREIFSGGTLTEEDTMMLSANLAGGE